MNFKTEMMMKVKGVFFTAILTAVLCISSNLSAATYGGGSGTALDPYQILTPEQINTIGATPADWASCFKLMADIDMAAYTGTQYNIIGNWTTKFTGTFDGDNHKIRNLTYSTTTSVGWVGLFGFTKSATLKNVGLENVSLYTRGSNVGGLVGIGQTSTITNCYSTGAVTSSFEATTSVAGGLVGGQYGGTIMNCTSAVSVAASDTYFTTAGGLVGTQSSGTITNCTSTGVATSSASGVSYAGGLVGNQVGGTITNCCSTGSVASYTLGNGDAYAGGLVANQNPGASISMCYSTGPVMVNGATMYKGGLLGYMSATATVAACFWDNQTSGITTSAGGSGAQGKTTALMKTLSTFTDAGWDFTDTDGNPAVWQMPALGYPYLAWKGCDTYPAGDSNQDCKVDMADFTILANNWLAGV
jgi:hypothetical protein